MVLNSKNKIVSVAFLIAFNLLFSQVDTLSVFQADTLVFNKKEVIIHRPCSNPELSVYYELKSPKENVYYFVYNPKKQLIKEGVVVFKKDEKGNVFKKYFLNKKRYYYKTNGYLDVINHDGIKSVYYKGKNEIKSIRYIDATSQIPTREEFYRKNKLVKTKVYTNFYANKYYTVKNRK